MSEITLLVCTLTWPAQTLTTTALTVCKQVGALLGTLDIVCEGDSVKVRVQGE